MIFLPLQPRGNFVLGCGDTSNHQYDLKIQTGNTDRMKFTINAGHVEAGLDNTQTFGTANKRWSEIFAGNGTINTSDERLKNFLGTFSEAETKVAVKLKVALTKFKWNDAIEREEAGGKVARVHVGIGAQTLARIFEKEGLDPNNYAMFCYDEWEEEVSTVQTNRGEVQEVEVVTERQKTQTVVVPELVEEVKLIDGKYTLVKQMKEVEREQPLYTTHPVYNEDGTEAVIKKTVPGPDGKPITITTPRVMSVPVMEEVKEVKEVQCEPVYETVVKKAGNRYGVRLDQVLAFILAHV